jgi:hypothetical protein
MGLEESLATSGPPLYIRTHRENSRVVDLANAFYCSSSGQENQRGIEASGEKYRPRRNSRPLFKLACPSRYSIFSRRRCATSRAMDSGDIWSR